uniref:Putative secreted protein n=1 Tax=Anopheles darlingi TaxID=43151 RepID=A0A2M4DI99_ANODA
MFVLLHLFYFSWLKRTKNAIKWETVLNKMYAPHSGRYDKRIDFELICTKETSPSRSGSGRSRLSRVCYRFL